MFYLYDRVVNIFKRGEEIEMKMILIWSEVKIMFKCIVIIFFLSVYMYNIVIK